jgi:hypothetical protein
MSGYLSEGESQEQNAERLRRIWSQSSLHALPEAGAVIEHPITRSVERLPGGGERVTIRLGQVSYYAGPGAAPDRLPDDA